MQSDPQTPLLSLPCSPRAVSPRLLCPQTSPSSGKCFILLGFQAGLGAPAQSPSSGQPQTAPREPQGAEVQVQVKPERKKVSAHLQPKVSCPGQTLLFPQKRAQSSLTRGPPRPQGHPLTALPGPDPGVCHSWSFNHMQKNVNSSPCNKEPVQPCRES